MIGEQRNTKCFPSGRDTGAVHGLEPSRIFLLCAFLATLGLLAFHLSVYWFHTDDAFISFRYALNLSEGHGLVFNPGYERVEGYTNFLWVVILAAVLATYARFDSDFGVTPASPGKAQIQKLHDSAEESVVHEFVSALEKDENLDGLWDVAENGGFDAVVCGALEYVATQPNPERLFKPEKINWFL